jgi:signal transduction histidine kinase
MENPVFLVSQSPDLAAFLPDRTMKSENLTSLRNAKKKLRSCKPSLVILCVGFDDDISLCQSVAQYIRLGLANQDTRIILMHNPTQQLDEVVWLEEYQINACLTASEAKAKFNASVLKRELATFEYIENTYRQHDAETEMLVCITRFSRGDEKLTALLSTFSNALARLCHAHCSFEIYLENTSRFRVRNSDIAGKDLVKTLQSLLSEGGLPASLAQAIEEQRPQIHLLDESGGLEPITQLIETHIGSYLAFPIVVYKRVVCLLLYLIPEQEMDRVSMKQITIINKAAEQLTVLLERKQAESSLKKQYTRLRDTLLELKSTKQALAHNEKLASIGRMAAGIAHEINNPLSFVISNFSSMDSYLDNIIQLQSMQSELLTAIDIQQDQKAAHLKQSLSEFEEQAGIPFVLEDIRAIVTDSFNGLQRVKNIISDLRSFSHNQTGEKAVCDLAVLFDDTLKIMRYELEDKINITRDVTFDGVLYTHSGLIEQVLVNIIKNAVQAMEAAHTAEPAIHISAAQQGAMLQIRIRDNGPGMTAETQQKIFEPFFTTKAIGEGTGLGLSVVYNIMQRLDGTIDCVSEPGAYTEFTLLLPLKQEEQPA